MSQVRKGHPGRDDLPKGDRVLEAKEALYRVLVKYRSQCLSQASMKTGHGMRALRTALEQLLFEGVVEPVPDQTRCSEELVSYRATK
jgi:hypothetical protein